MCKIKASSAVLTLLIMPTTLCSNTVSLIYLHLFSFLSSFHTIALIVKYYCFNKEVTLTYQGIKSQHDFIYWCSSTLILLDYFYLNGQQKLYYVLKLANGYFLLLSIHTLGRDYFQHTPFPPGCFLLPLGQNFHQFNFSDRNKSWYFPLE